MSKPNRVTYRANLILYADGSAERVLDVLETCLNALMKRGEVVSWSLSDRTGQIQRSG